jgi:alpha-L-arabinofuranosidase
VFRLSGKAHIEQLIKEYHKMKNKIAARMMLIVLSMYSIHPVLGQPSAIIHVSNQEMPISSDLFGIFFEDLNYAADGGLYPERVQNRSFEYSRGDNRNWNSLSFWQLLQTEDDQTSVSIETEHPLNKNNPHYAVLAVNRQGSRNGLSNEGFGGIVLTRGDKYDVSLFARIFSGRPDSIIVQVESPDGAVLAQAKLSGLKQEWNKHQAVIEAKADAANARLVVLISGTGKIGLDMISLFPQKTFKNRPNGLRPDLAQVIADLKPKFIRFPGGCLAHGDGLENMYRWKESIGPLEQRKAQRNIWRYHQTLGLGYFEYFQFCEDIGAKPLPVVPAGVCCQNSGNYLNLVPRGQQGIPMEEMEDYVQEVLDLVEYANGPVTSKWGARRAEAGHPEPFHLEYLGVGNEDVISEVFKVRYKMINDAVKAKYPEITVIGTTGPFTDGRDYDEGWKFARQEKLPMVDEHGYKSPAWFWENLERFDAYERTETKVYLGEYAAHESNRDNTLRSALAEAAYMTSLERNGDLVRLSSYAPLLAKQGNTQWRPDMIYFDNVSITPSINYYVQQLFSVNHGDAYLPTTVKIQTPAQNHSAAVPNGVLLGTWNTKAGFDEIKIISNDKVVLNESFDNTAKNWKSLSGQWSAADGVYSQISNETPALSMYAFEGTTSGYKVSLKAMKTGGAEGFLIGFGALDADNYYWLNLGGWNNTRHAIEKTVNGNRSSIGPSVDGRIEPNRWYDIIIQAADNRIKCYLDGKLIIDFMDRGFVKTPDIAASTVRDTKTGDLIVKIVSKADHIITAEIDLSDVGSFSSNAVKTVLSGDQTAVNRFGQTPQVLPQVSKINVSQTFDYEIPPHSLTVLRIQRTQ